MDKDNFIHYMIRHVFLPPKLPQKDDEDVEKDTCLIKALLAALISFRDKHDISEQQEERFVDWSACIKMLDNMLELRKQCGKEGELEADELEEKLSGMIDGGKVEDFEPPNPPPPTSLSLFLFSFFSA